MIELRPYQVNACIEALSALENKKSCLIVAPTGAGKTEIMIEVINQAIKAQGKTCLVITKRVKLVGQTHSRFVDAGLMSSVYCASLGRKDISACTIASIDSIHSVAEKHFFDYLVFDEVHNLSEDEDSRFKKTVKAMCSQGSKLIGFTATPFRANGYIYGDEKQFFDAIDFEITFKELIESDFLVPPILKSTKNKFDLSKVRVTAGEWNQNDIELLVSDKDVARLQVSEALSRLEERQKVFWQCSTIKHCELIEELLLEKGELVSIIHSKLSRFEQDEQQHEFEKGDRRHCVFVTMLSEGYNYPPADALVVLRPTRSPVLYVQTVGRILRPHEGKKNALVLDFGRVIENLGPIDRPRVAKKKGQSNESTLWACPECYTFNEVGTDICSQCGYQPESINQARPVVPKESTTTPQEEGSILAWEMPKDLETIEVEKVLLTDYQSKAGNRCHALTYYPKGGGFLLQMKPVTEYFVKGHTWSDAKARLRMRELGLTLQHVFQSEAGLKVVAPNTPSEIECKSDGRYRRITRLKFRERNRA